MKLHILSNYAARIKQLRKKFGLPQTGFADLTGISFAYITCWENEYAKPNLLAWRKKDRQRTLSAQQNSDLASLRREPEFITSNPITFLTHALVVPSNDSDDVKRRDDSIEANAMQVAIPYEETNGAEM